MKILHVINTLSAGGAELHLLTLCRHLKKDGAEIVVACLKDKIKGSRSIRADFETEGFRIVDLDANGRYYTEPFFKTDRTMNSAGGQIATLHDLARWTIVQMDSGRIDGRQVFPSSAVARSHRLIAKQTRDESKRFAYFDREGWGS